MEQKTVGAQTRRLRTRPSVLSFAAIGGRFEGEGPLREYFDELSEDHFFGEKTWERVRVPCSAARSPARWKRWGSR